jgi:hypothetical protein
MRDRLGMTGEVDRLPASIPLEPDDGTDEGAASVARLVDIPNTPTLRRPAMGGINDPLGSVVAVDEAAASDDGVAASEDADSSERATSLGTPSSDATLRTRAALWEPTPRGPRAGRCNPSTNPLSLGDANPAMASEVDLDRGSPTIVVLGSCENHTEWHRRIFPPPDTCTTTNPVSTGRHPPFPVFTISRGAENASCAVANSFTVFTCNFGFRRLHAPHSHTRR